MNTRIVRLATLLAAAWAVPAAAVTYEDGIRQAVEKYCSECHGSDAPSMAEFKADKEKYKKDKLGPRMDSYDNLMVMVNGSDTGAVMRRLDDGTNSPEGKPGNMYKHLGKSDEERAANLALFKSWIGGWTLKRAAEMGEAERQAILAPR